MKLKTNCYLIYQRHAAFIEIPADSVQTQHQGNLTTFGSDLGFMTGTYPDCPDIFMAGDV